MRKNIKQEIIKNYTKEINKINIEKRKKEWEKFINQNKWLNKEFGFENKETEVIISTYKKYISDNPDNIQIIVDALSEDGTLNLIQANTGSGKTNITNTVMNILRDNNRKEILDFKNSFSISNEECKNNDVYSSLKKTLEYKEFEICNKNAVKMHQIKEKKNRNSKLTDKDLEFIKNLNTEIESAIEELKRKFVEAQFKIGLSNGESIIPEINEYINSFKYVLTLILCPNKIQNIQNQEDEEYTFKAIVGNGKNQIQIEADTNYSMVYDKIYDLLSLLEITDKVKVRMVVDEAHGLVKDAEFRSNAITGIKKCVDKIISMNGSVAFMTATPESLSFFSFDKILSFIPEKKECNYDKAVIYTKNNESESMLEFVVKVAETLENPQIRLNSIKGIEKLDETFKKRGKTGFTLTSNDKEQNSDGTYKSVMFGNITKKAALPKGDYYIQTKMGDAGTNIKGILQEDGTIKQENITPLYIMNKDRECDFCDLKQYIARRRYAVKGSIVAITLPKALEKEREILSIEKIFKFEMEKVKTSMETFESFYSVAKIAYAKKEQLIENMLNIIEDQITEDEKKLNMRCIYFNEETMTIEMNQLAFWKNVYEKWMEQFFYNREALISMLSDVLEMPVDYFEGDLSDEKIKLCKGKVYTRYERELLFELLNSLKPREKQLLVSIIKKEATVKSIEDKNLKAKIDDIVHDRTFNKLFKKAIKAGADLEELIKAIDKSYCRNRALRELKNSNYTEEIEMVRNKTITIKELCDINEKRGKVVKNIMNTFRNNFNSKEETNAIVREILDNYVTENPEKVGMKYVLQRQFVNNNLLYINGITSLPSMEQQIVLEGLLELKEDGTAKNKRFDDKDIISLGKKLNKFYHTDKYTKERTLRIIKLCFIIEEMKEGYKIKYLKTEM